MDDRWLTRLHALFMNRLFLLAVGAGLLVVASLGVPMGNDEGVWGYIGRIWVEDGLLPYSGAVEQKTPIVYLVFALSHLIFGTNLWFPRAMAIAAAAGSGLLVYDAAKRMSTKRAAAIAMGVFILTMPLSSVDGPYVATETFMNLFRLLAFALLIRFGTGGERKPLLVFGAGVSYGLAIASKQIALLDAVPILCFLLAIDGRQYRTVARHCVFIAVGALAGTFLSILPLLLSGGTVLDYIDGAWIILTDSGITAATPVTRISGFFRHFFNVRLYFLSAGVIGYLAFYKQLKASVRYALPLLAWAAAEFAAYNAQGLYLDHHYKAFLPSFTIIFGITLDFVFTRLAVAGSATAERDQRMFFVVAMLGLFLFYIPFETNYYHTVRKFAKGLQDSSYRDLGLYLRDHTKEGDYVYHWGIHNGPIYYYSERNAPGRYFSSYFLKRPGAVQETQKDLAEHPPKFIVVPGELTPPDWLQELLSVKYKFILGEYGHTIYQAL